MPLTYGALCALAEKHNVTITENMRAFVRAVEEEKIRAQADARPVDMVLHCPNCGLQHIDAPEEDWKRDANGRMMLGTTEVTWTNPPHRSHLCHGCGHIWRPADVPTNGVLAVKTKGENDSPITGPDRVDDTHPEASAPGLSDDVIREVFLANGFTIKEGQTDLKPYVFSAARALLTHASAATVAEASDKLDAPAQVGSAHRDLKVCLADAQRTVSTTKKALSDLVNAVRWWGTQEDGIPTEVAPSFNAAHLALGWSLSHPTDFKAAAQQSKQNNAHEWDATGERCLKCGDKDWFAGSTCSGKAAQQQAEQTVQRCTSCGGAKVPQTLLATGACDCEQAEPGADERECDAFIAAITPWLDTTLGARSKEALRSAVDMFLANRVKRAAAITGLDALDAVRDALPEFCQQDDYLLAHGASLISDSSHEIIHMDTVKRIVTAARSGQRAGAPENDPYCPRCKGHGEETAMTNNGPDAEELTIACQHCGGEGSLSEAYKGVAKLLAEEQKKYLDACGKLWFERHGDAGQRAGVAEGWKPIETAPKDGREVLLTVKLRAGIKYGRLVGHYMEGGHCIEDHPPIAGGWYFWNGARFDKAAEPTHWMPLAAAPTQQQEGGS